MQTESGGPVNDKDPRDLQPAEIRQAGQHILYDALLDMPLDIDEHGLQPGVQWAPKWFDSGYWRARGDLKGEAQGRGAVFFFEYRGCEYVLRHYRRGGMVARLVTDQYIWTGLRSSRPWREWHLLAAMYALGLPVPKPFAARLIKNGVFYTADLITHKIPGGVSLAETLTVSRPGQAVWRKIGSVIRRFHDAGVEHADLNAHNILLTDKDVFLIDFDNGRMHAPDNYRKRLHGWRRGNLQRLLRSLKKLGGQRPAFHFSAGDWRFLLEGYGN
jgi:3-deoxy-D-manno-octulosonic acid kinase